MIEWQTGETLRRDYAMPTHSRQRESMSRNSPNQHRITAGLPSALKTVAKSQDLQENYREKQGYNCGYIVQSLDSFSANFNRLSYYFDDRRGHQISP